MEEEMVGYRLNDGTTMAIDTVVLDLNGTLSVEDLGLLWKPLG